MIFEQESRLLGKNSKISGAKSADAYTAHIDLPMPSSDDTFDTYVSLLKRVRIVSSNPSQSKECMIAFTHASFVLDEREPAEQAAGDSVAS